MEAIRKITVHVPADLLDKARKTTGSGITATVRQGLQLVTAADTYRRLRKLRGSASTTACRWSRATVTSSISQRTPGWISCSSNATSTPIR